MIHKIKPRKLEMEAVQFNGSNFEECFTFYKSIHDVSISENCTHNSLHIVDLDGNFEIFPSDWIIKGVTGQFFKCDDKEFRETYEIL